MDINRSISPKSKPTQFSSQLWEILIFAAGFSLCVLGIIVVIVRLKYLVSNIQDLPQDINAAKNLLANVSIYSIYNDHPPFDSIIFIPLALIPYNIAIYAWTAFSVLSFIISVMLVIKELHIKLSPGWRTVLIGFSLLWYPVLFHIAVGQLSMLIGLLLIISWWFLRRNHDLAAGFTLGLAALIKVFPGLILLYLIVRKRWKAAYCLAAAYFIGSVITVLIVGIGDFIKYFTTIAIADARAYAVFPINFSISGLFNRLFNSGPWVQPITDAPEVGTWVTVLASMVVLVLFISQTRKTDTKEASDDQAFALAILAMLLISPVTWGHSLVLLIFPLGLIAAKLQARPEPKLRILSLIALILFSLPDVQLANSLMAYYAPYPMTWYASLILMAPMVGIIILWVLLISDRWGCRASRRT